MDWAMLFWSTVTVILHYYPTRLVAMAILAKLAGRGV